MRWWRLCVDGRRRAGARRRFEIAWYGPDHQVVRCDIVVLETGMGGRLDSTNVVPTAEACAITNIGLDHQQFLGPDIRSIARKGRHSERRRAGGRSMRPEAQSEILAAALRSSSEMHFALERVPTCPPARWGQKAPWMVNGPRRLLAKVLEAAGWACPRSAMEEGLWNHAVHSGQQGRWQVRSSRSTPGSLMGAQRDGENGGQAEFDVRGAGGQLHVVWAPYDKDLDAVLSLLPSDAVCHWCQADIPRALPPMSCKRKPNWDCRAVVLTVWRTRTTMRSMWPSLRTSFGWEGACSWWATCCVIWTKKAPAMRRLDGRVGGEGLEPRPPV